MYTRDVTIEIEAAGPDDFPAAIWPALNVFGMTGLSDEELEQFRYHYDEVRVLGVRDGDDWVATIGDIAFELTVPGGAALPAAGVTIAGVLPTHRRQGILTALMAKLLDDTVERGWPVAILLASEASIYARFGYGVASRFQKVKVDPRHVNLRTSPDDNGSLRLVSDKVEATRLAAVAWDNYRSTRPGLTSRADSTWEDFRRDLEGDRDGASGWNWVIHFDAEGEADGYAVYRMKEEEREALPAGSLKVQELVAATTAVEISLFRFLCTVDLVRSVEFAYRPVDDPLLWLFEDHRQYVVTQLSDFLWLRVIDVATTLAARTYGTTDEFVLEVDDQFRPSSGGRFRLSTRPDGATCERIEPGGGDDDYRAVLAMDSSTLATLTLAAESASTLAAAGRIRASPEALTRADACFRSGPAPFAITDF